MPGDFEFRDQAKKQESTFDAEFQTFCNSCNLSLPLKDSTYGQLKKLIDSVWDMPIKTLFVSRNTMEMTGVMRQTVENALTSVNQVNLNISGCICWN